MAFNVQIFLRSSDFSQEFADANNDGEETAENVRHEWEDEFRITGEFSKVEVLRDQVYTLAGERGDGSVFSFDIPNVTIFAFHGDEGVSPLVVSERSLDEYVLQTDRKRLEIYLNDSEVVENPIPGIYIALPDFPKELRS